MMEEKRLLLPYNEYGRALSVVRAVKGTRHEPPGEGGDHMAEVNWQDRYLQTLEADVREIKADFRAMRSEVKSDIAQFKDDIATLIKQSMDQLHHLDTQRREDISEARKEIASIRESVEATNKWIVGLVITTIAAIAAMVLTVVLR